MQQCWTRTVVMIHFYYLFLRNDGQNNLKKWVSDPPQYIISGEIWAVEQSPDHMTPPYTIQTSVA